MASTFVLDPAVNVIASVPRWNQLIQKRQYKDKYYTGDDWEGDMEKTTTVYVGNLSIYTNEYQLHELFSRCGSVKRIIMGLHKVKKTPCGFCFVEFDEREAALRSVKCLNRVRLEGRELKVDLDTGFTEGKQFGRGPNGGQVADERRQINDQRAAMNQRGYGGAPGIGGSGNILTRTITIVACLSILSIFMITCMTTQVEAVDKQPAKPITLINLASNRYGSNQNTQYLNPVAIRKAQLTEARNEFEKSFAAFLVNIMKAAKPTLLKAFISATLADKQLKDIAIAMFFNNTESD